MGQTIISEIFISRTTLSNKTLQIQKNRERVKCLRFPLYFSLNERGKILIKMPITVLWLWRRIANTPFCFQSFSLKPKQKFRLGLTL